MQSKLIFTKQIITSGTADDIEKVSFVEQRFTQPTDIMVQAFLTASTFNQQHTGFWKLELTVDSWEAVENGIPKLHTVPAFSIFNAIEIQSCNWVKVRLTARNGHGSGIVNIYG